MSLSGGVARELVPETVWRSLCAVEGLRYGEAAETEPIKPVPEEHIVAIEEFVTPQIWAMVNVQLWTGCRPGEACAMRTINLRMKGKVWEYTPESHKTEHHGKQRVIYIGPKGQQIVKSWLKPDLQAYLFSPREAREWYVARRAKSRKTPVPPSQRKRKRKKHPKRAPAERYTTYSYSHAIARACERVGIPPWAPNRLTPKCRNTYPERIWR